MKKSVKLISLLLALVMAFSAFPFAMAASGERYPIVNILGINSSTIYTDVDDPSSEFSFISVEEITEIVKAEVAPALIRYAADKDADKLAEVVSDLFNVIFDGWFNDADGTPRGNSGAIVNYPSKNSISRNSTLTFDWDWRGNPITVAAELDKFINYVTESAGCEKVAITCHSLGSVVVLAYLSIYGDSKLSGVVFDTPALDGVNYVGELLMGNMVTDGDALVYAIDAMLGANENSDVINSLMDIFTLAGIPDELSALFNSVLDEMAPVLYRDTLVPLFARMPTVWAMTPTEDIDDAMDYIFTEYLTDEDSMVLKATIEEYNERVRKDAHKTLLDFDENAVVAVFSRYGFSSLPLTDRWTETGDTVIETSNNSIGATTAPFGDYFDDNYLADKDVKYISPDKTVDASTCLFPEKTWYLKNIKHASTAVTKPYYAALLFGEEEATCDTFELSRFSLYDEETGTLVKDDSAPEKIEEKTPFEVLFDFLKMLFKRFMALFSK